MVSHQEEKNAMQRVFQHFKNVEQHIRLQLLKENMSKKIDDDLTYWTQIGLM